MTHSITGDEENTLKSNLFEVKYLHFFVQQGFIPGCMLFVMQLYALQSHRGIQ